MANVGQVTYMLECGHAVSAPATLVSGKLLCPWHDEFSLISGVQVWEWRARCHSCRFARWAGQSKQTAELFANSHCRKNPPHHVDAEYTINAEARNTLRKFTEWRCENSGT
jgi:hypothetical protein